MKKSRPPPTRPTLSLQTTQSRRRIASVLNGDDIPTSLKTIVHSPSDDLSKRKTPSRFMQRLSSRTMSGSKKSMVARHQTHPLNVNNPVSTKCFQYIKLEFIEDELTYPAPRCQDLPDHAFGELDRKSVLVALSYPWFYQNHPDPQGTKFEMFKRDFVPKIRKKFPPPTKIFVFDDWLCCPQWPRTEDEQEIFDLCMEHMTSVYVYCDHFVFFELPIPESDNTCYYTNVRPSNYIVRALGESGVQVTKISPLLLLSLSSSFFEEEDSMLCVSKTSCARNIFVT